MYARFDPSRTVHGLDPLRANVERALSSYGVGAPNLRMHVGGLGDVETVADAGPGKVRGQMHLSDAHFRRGAAPFANASNTTFRVHTLDGLFSSDGLFGDEHLGFAHIDVEGFELRVMRGAREVLRRDRPLVSVEAHVHLNLTYTRELLDELAASGYETYLVEEMCGVRADCRNILAFPRSRHAEFDGSPTLKLALTTLALLPTSASVVAEQGFPCCARGGACCPAAHGPCCTERTTSQWLAAQVNPPPFSRRGWIVPRLAF
ncbi:hypothetical protein KFE25_012266 [Diacronema lutheri]|uniref:Methyltransferase FkbM domain-containing protein n=1 Tax=Diacronema lutheri TaxID=2081491 RepID=A0A8J6CET0_DIALT|nr:hypothetical protein KFE25_012266 [Diacronema lutheri]